MQGCPCLHCFPMPGFLKKYSSPAPAENWQWMTCGVAFLPCFFRVEYVWSRCCGGLGVKKREKKVFRASGLIESSISHIH